MNLVGKGLDRAIDCASAVIVDALTFDATLLVWNSHGCFCGCKEKFQRGFIGDEVAGGITEGHILDPERDCPFAFVAGFGIFSNPEEIVESNIDQVSNGFTLGAGPTGLGPGAVVHENCFSDGDGDCQLGCCGRVLMLVAFHYAMEGAPVGPVGMGLVEGVGEAVQFKGLADGAKCRLN